MPIPLVFETIPVNRNFYEFNIKMESIIRLEDFPTVLIQKKSLVPHISQQPAHAEKGAPRAVYIPLPPPSKEPTEILDIDKDTPDKHVPRDPRLIRLTGIHPFNVEPPLTSLYDEGNSLFRHLTGMILADANLTYQSKCRISYLSRTILREKSWLCSGGSSGGHS